MPILKDFRTTKTITLPSWADSKVEIYHSLLVGDLKNINHKSDNQVELIVESLPAFIKSWNFTDEAGQTLEINRENLNFLQMEDVTYIGEQIIEFGDEIKKKLNGLQS